MEKACRYFSKSRSLNVYVRRALCERGRVSGSTIICACDIAVSIAVSRFKGCQTVNAGLTTLNELHTRTFHKITELINEK